MNGREEAAALLTLLRDNKRGWGQIADDVEEAGSALAVLALERPDDLFTTEDILAPARTALSEWETDGIHVTTLFEERYPQQLLGIHQRPPFLSYMGTLSPEADRLGVAIVGTRKPSEDGVRRACELAAGLAERGVTVVSGLAAGIDTAAHTAAL